MPAARAARLLFQLPRSCRVFVALSPANQWGWDEMFANKMSYSLEMLVWMKSKDAAKKTPRHKPKPFVPDFLKKPEPPSPINKDSVAAPAENVANILAQPRG